MIAQDPGGGSEVKKDSEVEIIVSNGEGTVDMPNVDGPARGHGRSQRSSSRGATNITVIEQETEDESEDGRVIDQAPSAGTQILATDRGDDLRRRVRRAGEPDDPTTTATIDGRARAEGCAHEGRGDPGGRSSEHDVSIRSGESVAAGLEEAGHEVVLVLIERDGRWLPDRKRSSCGRPRPARRGRRLPRAPRAVRRGRDRPGAARVSRRPVRGAERARRRRSRWTS